MLWDLMKFKQSGDKKEWDSGLWIPYPVFFAVPQCLPEIKSNTVQRKKKSLISWKKEEEIRKDWSQR